MNISPAIKAILVIIALSLLVPSLVIIYRKPLPNDNLKEVEEKKSTWRIVSYICYAILAVVVGPEIYYYIKNGRLSF